jgi:predicted nucleotide-binding protein
VPNENDLNDEWVEKNRTVVDESFRQFMETGEWPKTSELRRHFAVLRQDIDVQAVANTRPSFPGELRGVFQQDVSMSIRQLRYLPRAQMLVNICLAIARRAAVQYRAEDAVLQVSSSDPAVLAPAGQDRRLVARAAKVLGSEQPSPIGPYGGPEDEFTLWINELCATLFENVFSADDFIAAQDRVLIPKAKEMATHHVAYAARGATESLTEAPLPFESEQAGSDIFIVHGRGDHVGTVSAEILRITGIAPIVVQDTPDRGSPTVIEKLEREAAHAGYALVILSGDDEGRLRGADDELRPRARQNVVAELGFFIGRLGRERVKVLYDPIVDLPSDFGGITYIQFGPPDTWRDLLTRELAAMGVEIAAAE